MERAVYGRSCLPGTGGGGPLGGGTDGGLDVCVCSVGLAGRRKERKGRGLFCLGGVDGEYSCNILSYSEAHRIHLHLPVGFIYILIIVIQDL